MCLHWLLSLLLTLGAVRGRAGMLPPQQAHFTAKRGHPLAAMAAIDHQHHHQQQQWQRQGQQAVSMP